MNWSLFISTFMMILVAEMGDKTQLAAMSASANTQGRGEFISVWLAAVMALIVAASLGVLAGKLLSQYLTPQITKWVSGVLFIGIGVWTLTKSA